MNNNLLYLIQEARSVAHNRLFVEELLDQVIKSMTEQSVKIWITRPYSHEIYMGGDRSLEMWIMKPRYDERTQEKWNMVHRKNKDDEFLVTEEIGWSYGGSGSLRVKNLLKKQAPEIYKKVWHEVYDSVLPRQDVIALTPEEEEVWSQNMDNWHMLTEDRKWESKVRTNFKRFLLEVNLTTGEVKRVMPEVVPSDRRDGASGFITTDKIEEHKSWTVCFVEHDHNRPYALGEFPEYTAGRPLF